MFGIGRQSAPPIRCSRYSPQTRQRWCPLAGSTIGPHGPDRAGCWPKPLAGGGVRSARPPDPAPRSSSPVPTPRGSMRWGVPERHRRWVRHSALRQPVVPASWPLSAYLVAYSSDLDGAGDDPPFDVPGGVVHSLVWFIAGDSRPSWALFDAGARRELRVPGSRDRRVASILRWHGRSSILVLAVPAFFVCFTRLSLTRRRSCHCSDFARSEASFACDGCFSTTVGQTVSRRVGWLARAWPGFWNAILIVSRCQRRCVRIFMGPPGSCGWGASPTVD